MDRVLVLYLYCRTTQKWQLKVHSTTATFTNGGFKRLKHLLHVYVFKVLLGRKNRLLLYFANVDINIYIYIKFTGLHAATCTTNIHNYVGCVGSNFSWAIKAPPHPLMLLGICITATMIIIHYYVAQQPHNIIPHIILVVIFLYTPT